jgi:SAM-dependent methyltransferase
VDAAAWRAPSPGVGPSGSYEGLDACPILLDWCRRELQPRLTNFNFRFADVYARAHNPSGLVDAKDFRFPYSKDSFDLCISASLFTHMLSDGTENYAREIARVLRPGGRLFVTLFLFDTAAERAVAADNTIFAFRHRVGPCLTIDPKLPEEAVAYDEQWFLDVLLGTGLQFGALRRGNWRSRRSYEITQDAVVAFKPEVLTPEHGRERPA